MNKIKSTKPLPEPDSFRRPAILLPLLAYLCLAATALFAYCFEQLGLEIEGDTLPSLTIAVLAALPYLFFFVGILETINLFSRKKFNPSPSRKVLLVAILLNLTPIAFLAYGVSDVMRLRHQADAQLHQRDHAIPTGAISH